ncbi:MAG: hypothetical protein FWC26_06480, partial [Fibromonadales bacterium]|nr:hypothetical protein [Fibromonadales bacterium]
MRDYNIEVHQRVEFIRSVVKSANASGIVYGNSGGKDCTLVGILCKMACDNTVGIMMPCGSKRNLEEDKAHAEAVAGQFSIETRLIDLCDVKNEFVQAVGVDNVNIAPRLRMTTLYAIAANENRL